MEKRATVDSLDTPNAAHWFCRDMGICANDSAMRRLSDSFGPRRYRSHRAPASDRPALQDSALHNHHQSHTTTTTTTTQNCHKPQPSVGMVTDNLEDIRNYVRGVSTHIQCLQGLTDEERSMVAEVTAIERQMEMVDRSLGRFYIERCHGLSEGAEKLVGDATRHAWRSYRSVVKLEKRIKGTNSREGASNIELTSAEPRRGRRRTRVVERHKAYTSTSSERKPSPTSLNVYNESDEGTYEMSGALVIGEESIGIGPEPLRNALDILRHLPRVLTRGASSQITASLDNANTHPEKIPQPRHEVTRRIQQEEANVGSSLRDPDRVRRGSWNGFMITELVMKRTEDAEFVLPCLHYIKVHEVRYLKRWFADEGHITSSGPISRMEKVLSCVQLLQTGCRYEALAVIYSRSPRQVKESCIEVMQGLLKWHHETVRDGETGEQAMYLPLWGIWTKFVVTDGRAGLYFGFEWTHVAKVLVALNVYMGRWRMQGKFAVDGPAFVWGKFFMSHSIDNVPSLADGDGGDATSEFEV